MADKATIQQKYTCQSISEVNEITEAATRLRALRITVTPHPDPLRSLWTWTVEVKLAGGVQ